MQTSLNENSMLAHVFSVSNQLNHSSAPKSKPKPVLECGTAFKNIVVANI